MQGLIKDVFIRINKLWIKITKNKIKKIFNKKIKVLKFFNGIIDDWQCAFYQFSNCVFTTLHF